jgi:hypothetical protein
MRGQRVLIQERGLLRIGGAIDVNQPEIDLELCRISAKLALAIYYQERGQPASKDCRINTQWTHVQNAAAVQSVQRMIASIPKQAILQMGKWNTEPSFFLKYHFEAGQMFSVAIFHESVALMAQLSEPQVQHWGDPWTFVMAPTPGSGIVPVT